MLITLLTIGVALTFSDWAIGEINAQWKLFDKEIPNRTRVLIDAAYLVFELIAVAFAKVFPLLAMVLAIVSMLFFVFLQMNAKNKRSIKAITIAAVPFTWILWVAKLNTVDQTHGYAVEWKTAFACIGVPIMILVVIGLIRLCFLEVKKEQEPKHVKKEPETSDSSEPEAETPVSAEADEEEEDNKEFSIGLVGAQAVVIIVTIIAAIILLI